MAMDSEAITNVMQARTNLSMDNDNNYKVVIDAYFQESNNEVPNSQSIVNHYGPWMLVE
ncbi:putative variant antigen protein Cir/Yir/Bir [Sesbania bispinosa]|nr:putative variant antigen protein Cir/Yir/Bir [Sesbania bispinosa]